MNRRQILTGGVSLAVLGTVTAYVASRQMGSSSDYNDAAESMRSLLSAQPEARDLIRFATLAPNGHNTQPWRFAIAQRRITILPDFSRRTPVVDPDDHHIFASLGCAAENLALAAAARGHPGELRFVDANDGSIDFAYIDSAPAGSALFDAIPHRQSTRADYYARAVRSADLKTLAAAATIPGVDMVLINDRPQMDRLSDLVVAGTSAQMGDPAFLRELKSWLRFSPRQALKSGDGLYSAASGNPSLPEWLGQRIFDMLVTAQSESDKYARQLRSSAGVAVFIGAQNNREHWVLAGRSCQRFALQATALGLKLAFINQPVEVATLRPELAALVGMPGRRADIVMRFGYGPSLRYSVRRPIETVIAA
ncbi:MAG: Tat pathway signal protein [Gammaproteobacteria bacterium]